MEQSLEIYRSVIAQQPVCDDSWLVGCLQRSRAGDDGARRRILGSCLRLALSYVETNCRGRSEPDFFGLLQDANAALEEGLASFQGETAAELEQCLRVCVEQRIAALVSEKGNSEA